MSKQVKTIAAVAVSAFTFAANTKDFVRALQKYRKG